MPRKSVVDEIIEGMEKYLNEIDAGDHHFDQGVLKNNRSAAHYAIANAIGNAKAIRDFRQNERKNKNRK